MRAILEVVARENAAKVQGALYRIAELASAAEDMQEFYRAIHEVVGELMDARNFYIALYDEERQLINCAVPRRRRRQGLPRLQASGSRSAVATRAGRPVTSFARVSRNS